MYRGNPLEFLKRFKCCCKSRVLAIAIGRHSSHSRAQRIHPKIRGICKHLELFYNYIHLCLLIQRILCTKRRHRWRHRVQRPLVRSWRPCEPSLALIPRPRTERLPTSGSRPFKRPYDVSLFESLLPIVSERRHETTAMRL